MTDDPLIRWHYAALIPAGFAKTEEGPRELYSIREFDTLGELAQGLGDWPPKGARVIRYEPLVVQRKVTIMLDRPDPPQAPPDPSASCYLSSKGQAYPRTCPVCKLGPCKWPELKGWRSGVKEQGNDTLGGLTDTE